MSEKHPDLTTAAQALEEAYEKIGDLGGSAAEVKVTVSWISESGRPMSLSVGDTSDFDDDPEPDFDDDPDDDSYLPDEIR